jgi:hypothetical protein
MWGHVVAMVPEAVYTAARINAEQAVQKAQKMEAIGNLTGALHIELMRKRNRAIPLRCYTAATVSGIQLGDEKASFT